jgi:PST family polysaccharide transporter
VLFGSLTMALIMQSDKLVIGKVRTAEFLGVYFFGYQLVSGVARPFVSSLTQVLMPTLSHLSEDAKRQSRAYLKAVGTLTFCTSAFGFGIAVLAGPLVHLVWFGKWDASVPVLQIFASGLPIIVMSAVATTLIESRAKWRDVAWIQAAQGILTALAAFAGAASGNLALTALSVVSVALLAATVKSLRACQLVGLSPARLGRTVATSLLTPALCALSSLAIGSLTSDLGVWVSLALCATVYVLLLLLACLTYLRRPFQEIFTLLGRRRS